MTPEDARQDIVRAAQDAAELQSYLDSGERTGTAGGDETRSGTSTASKAPLSLDLLSPLEQAHREVAGEIAAIREVLAPLDGPAPAPAGVGLDAGYQFLADHLGQIPEEYATAVSALVRTQRARYACAKAVAAGTPPRPCPHQHPDHHRPANTLIPERLLGGEPGVMVCVHAACEEAGRWRRFRYLGDLPPIDPDAEVTLDFVSALTGIKYMTLYQAMRRADPPVTPIGTEGEGRNRKNTFRFGDIVTVRAIAARLALPPRPPTAFGAA